MEIGERPVGPEFFRPSNPDYQTCSGVRMAAKMDIPVITTPKSIGTVNRLADFIEMSGNWHSKHFRPDTGMLSDLWYRGVNRHFDSQAPGVYRPDFTNRAEKLTAKEDLEDKRLRLEREMISTFRVAGAAFLSEYGLTEIYFSAQHYGMPTRLLDWSTNPLAALFFACDGAEGQDGFVYAMDAKKVIPAGALQFEGSKERLWPSIYTMRFPMVDSAISRSFWVQPKPDVKPCVLPVRPDVVPGRIGQQSSCFTFHMHRANPVDNPTLITINVKGSQKRAIREELHRVNINQFTTYYDLDHLSKETRRGWGL
jgi:FRG domain